MRAPTVNLFRGKWFTEAANPPITDSFCPQQHYGFLDITISPYNMPVKQPNIFKLIWELVKPRNGMLSGGTATVASPWSALCVDSVQG